MRALFCQVVVSSWVVGGSLLRPSTTMYVRIDSDTVVPVLTVTQDDYNGPFILWAAEPDEFEESNDSDEEE